MSNNKTCSTSDSAECSAQNRKQDESPQELLDSRRLESRLSRIRHKILVLSGKGDVGKSTIAVNLAAVLDVVENMSGVICPKCRERVDIFKTGGRETMAARMNVPFLGRLPIDPAVTESADTGRPCVYGSDASIGKTFKRVAHALRETLERSDFHVC